MHGGGMHGGGHAWQGDMHGRGVCMAEGMCGRGACMAGGMCGRGHAWCRGACMPHMPPQALQLRYTVNERAVRILLECILVAIKIWCLLRISRHFVFYYFFVHNLSYVNVPSVILFFPPTPHPTQHHLVHHCIQLLRFGFAHNSGCGKAMFSQSSVSHSVPRGEVVMSGPQVPSRGGWR